MGKEYLYYNNAEYNSIYGKDFISKNDNIRKLKESLQVDDEELSYYRNRMQSITYNEIKITLMMVPGGSPRARTGSSGHFYVKGQSKIRSIMQEMIEVNGLICTSTKIRFKFYLPTPIDRLSDIDIILAEEEELTPLVDPDFDNLPKGYTDALQNVLLLNDKVVQGAIIDKYYSINPRIEMTIYYKDDFECDYNRKLIENSKAYKDLFK